jgi:hypothetical protein
METAQTCACTCTTTDSALSIAANVISLVTLAYVVLVGIGYRVAIRQRSRTRSSNLYNDICTLQKKVESIQDSVRSKKVQGENDLDMILYMANHQLKSLINQFNVGYESDDKWYLIWKELQLARKREEWEKMLGTVKHQVDFYLNYRYVEQLFFGTVHTMLIRRIELWSH